MIFEDPRELPRTGSTILRLHNTRLDLETFAPLFVRHLQAPKFEATKLCQLPSGLLLDNIEPALAEAVAQDLRTHGEDCLVVPAIKVVSLPRPHPVHAMQLSRTGLAVRSATDDWYSLRWEDLTCLAMGQAAVEQVKRTTKGMLTRRITAPGSLGGDPLSTVASALAPRSNVSVSKTSSQHQLLEFASLVPLACCRLDARHFDYSILGDQLQSSSTANVLTLARWLLTYAPQMKSNVDTERLKQTGTTALPNVDSHGLTEIASWLANLRQFENG
jgi:hypothetical protein